MSTVTARRPMSLPVKRAMDLLLSIPALIVLGPLLALLAFLVRLDSRGPAFYGQVRVGRMGEPFTLWKLRTMYDGSSQDYHRKAARAWFDERMVGETYKSEDDPRITRLGKYLRRSNLDELPQLLNIVRGEMSLVGPRPMMPYDRPLYEPWYFEREVIRPGVTGLWQVSGRDRLSAGQMMTLDVRYVRERSVWLDVKLIALTIPAILSDLRHASRCKVPKRACRRGLVQMTLAAPRLGMRRERLLAVVTMTISLSSALLVASALPARTSTASCSTQWGMYEPSSPWDSSMTAIRNLDTAVNRHSSIVHWYAQWGDPGSGPFNLHQSTLLNTARNYTSVGVTGSTPLITWEPWGPAPYSYANNTFPLARIAAGDFDSYIDSWAGGMQAYGGPVLLDFAHEMDGPWYPWGSGVNGNTPDVYIAAFRHVHDRFVLAGATNVQFVWNVNVWNPGGVDPRVFYPGDGYVDWMAIDVFNWGASGGGWSSLAQALTVVNTYSRLASLSTKPMMLAEWGSAEATSQDPPDVSKSQWILDAAQALNTGFPQVTAVVWFSNSGTPFALDSSASSLNAAQTAFGGCPS